MRVKNKLVYGFGTNDADYAISRVVNGKKVTCPTYTVWHSMISRCYSIKCQERRPTYQGCCVCEEWRSFSRFRAWMTLQDHVNLQLDKDILVPGNKVYSPSTCVFVTPMVNTFSLDCGSARGLCLVGVWLNKYTGKFGATISGHTRRRHLGYFTTESEAHHAWARAKRSRAYELASEQTDERVAQALRNFGDRVVANADSLLQGDSQRITASA